MGGTRPAGAARNALLADVVPPAVYGRAYGFERTMDNLGAIAGPLLALGLVAALGVRAAIGLSVIPGLLAAAAIIYAIRHTPGPHARQKQPLRIRIRRVLHGKLGPLIAAIGCYEAGNAAATLLILRATQLLTPEHGSKTATTLALSLYVLYNLAATLASLPAGRASDRLGSNGPAKVLAAGSPCADRLSGCSPPSRPPGNLAASAVAGVLWTTISPAAAFTYLAAWTLLALAGLALAARQPAASS